MPTRANARADLVARMTLEEGQLMLEGTRAVILPAAILATIEAASREIVGRGASAILYLAGEKNGREVATRVWERMRASAASGVPGLSYLEPKRHIPHVEDSRRRGGEDARDRRGSRRR